MMRAGAAQPKHPSSRNVIITDVTGDVFNGSKARTASNRNSQGSERNRSTPAVTKRSQTSAQVSRRAADQPGKQRGKQRRGRRQQQGDARAVEQAGKAVATQFVGAQPELRRWRSADEFAGLLGIGVLCKPARRERGRDGHSQNSQRDFLFETHSAAPGFQAVSAMSARLFTTSVISATRTVIVTSSGRSRSRAARQASCPMPGVSQITSMGMEAPKARLTEIPGQALPVAARPE